MSGFLSGWGDAISSAFGFADDIWYTNQEKAETQTSQNAIDAGEYTSELNAQIAESNNQTILITVGIAAGVAIMFIIFRK